MKQNKDAEFIGRKYGRWTIIKPAKRRGYRKVFLCECECGTLKEVLKQNLTRGKSKSCGCLARDLTWKGYGELPSTYWSRLKSDAKYRDLSFELDIEYGWNLFLKQDRRCALTGIPIKFAKDTRSYWAKGTTASLDRIDSSKPYIIGNVQWVHKTVNKIKQNLQEDELIEWAILLVEHNQEKSEKIIDRYQNALVEVQEIVNRTLSNS